MDLAKKLIERRNDRPGLDDLGLPLPGDPEHPSLDYMVARIITRNPHIYQEKNGDIYLGMKKITENQANLVQLSNTFNVYAKGARHQLVWNKLREILPVFDDTKLWIAPGVLWDKEDCSFVEQPPQDNYV